MEGSGMETKISNKRDVASSQLAGGVPEGN